MENKKRVALIFVGAVDSFLGGIILLLYFGILPFDISGWDIPRWAIGMTGAALLFPGIAVFTYLVTRNDS